MSKSKSTSLLGVVLTVIAVSIASSLLVAVVFAAYSAGFAALVFVANALLNWVGGIHYLGFYKTLAVGALCNIARLFYRGIFG